MPPDTATVWLYAVLAEPFGRLVVEMEGVVPVLPVPVVDVPPVVTGVVTVVALVVISRYAGLLRSPPRNVTATTVPTAGGVVDAAAVADVEALVVNAQAHVETSVPSTCGMRSWHRPMPSGSAVFDTVA